VVRVQRRGFRPAVLLTSLLDPVAYPAADFGALYHERWEIESALDELKTHLRGARIVLRSKTAELVRQEFYGLLMAHFAVRALMHEAAQAIEHALTADPVMQQAEAFFRAQVRVAVAVGEGTFVCGAKRAGHRIEVGEGAIRVAQGNTGQGQGRRTGGRGVPPAAGARLRELPPLAGGDDEAGAFAALAGHG
jgi:hypothetical protein